MMLPPEDSKGLVANNAISALLVGHPFSHLVIAHYRFISAIILISLRHGILVREFLENIVRACVPHCLSPSRLHVELLIIRLI